MNKMGENVSFWGVERGWAYVVLFQCNARTNKIVAL